MRFARNLAALIALATVGFAVGDFASHPNPAGAVAIVVLIAVFTFILSYLFRPAGGRVKRRPEPAPVEEPKPRRQPAAETVWAGWDADEAKRARERRR